MRPRRRSQSPRRIDVDEVVLGGAALPRSLSLHDVAVAREVLLSASDLRLVELWRTLRIRSAGPISPCTIEAGGASTHVLQDRLVCRLVRRALTFTSYRHIASESERGSNGENVRRSPAATAGRQEGPRPYSVRIGRARRSSAAGAKAAARAEWRPQATPWRHAPPRPGVRAAGVSEDVALTPPQAARRPRCARRSRRPQVPRAVAAPGAATAPLLLVDVELARPSAVRSEQLIQTIRATIVAKGADGAPIGGGARGPGFASRASRVVLLLTRVSV